MNKTRQQWNDDFECPDHKENSLTAFTAVAISMVCLVGSFYLAVYIYGKRTEGNYEVFDDQQAGETREETPGVETDVNVEDDANLLPGNENEEERLSATDFRDDIDDNEL
jgi:hypothetical protein